MVDARRAVSRGHAAALVFVSLLIAAACSKSGSSEADAGTAPPTTTTTRAASAYARIGSCDRVSVTSTCSEYSGTYLVHNEALLTSSCQRLSGTFVYAECPNTSLVGACTLSTGEVRRFYATGGAGWEVDRAKSECEASLRGSFK